MAHDVFISYSVKDKAVADAVCATLEAGGLRCWIAPRDVSPGGTWAQEIVQAIGGSRVLVLIFSSHSDNSEMVNRELDIATDCRLAIIPFRIEDITPSGETRFYLAGKHWLDAMTPPLERHLEALAAALQPLLHLVGPREAEAGPEGRGGKPAGPLEDGAAALSPIESAALAAPARSPRTEPPSHPVSHAKNGERRFKLKKWHYLVLLPVLGLLILLIVVPQLLGTAENAKIEAKVDNVKAIMSNALSALVDEDFTRAISLYEMALKAAQDPEIPSELRVQMQSGLAQVYYSRGLTFQVKGEFKKAIADFEKAASLVGLSGDPRFLANLKKAAAAAHRSAGKNK